MYQATGDNAEDMRKVALGTPYDGRSGENLGLVAKNFSINYDLVGIGIVCTVVLLSVLVTFLLMTCLIRAKNGTTRKD